MLVRHNFTSTLVVLVISLTLVLGQQQLNDKCQLIEQVRQMFTTGYPDLGIKPLDPMQVDHFSLKVLEPTASVNVNIDATGIKIWNMKTFVVNNIKSSVDSATTNFDIDITIPVLRITADKYTMKGTIMVFLPVRGNGRMDISLIDVRAVATATFNKTNVSRSIEDLDVYITVGKMQARLTGTAALVNSLLNQHGASLINGKRNEISAAIKQQLQQLIPVLNQYLANNNVALQ